MSETIKIGLFFGCLPSWGWLLGYEIWALANGYGYTLSECVWWLVYRTFAHAEPSMPPQVRTSLIIG